MKKLLALFFVIWGVALLTSFNHSFPPASELVIIVNHDNPVSTLTLGEAKLYYLRKIKSRWPGINKNIRPADRSVKSSERDAFYNGVLKMNDKEVEGYFAERQFQNAERLPDKFSSDAEIISFVGSEPGAIGYVRSKSLTSDVKVKVKVILEF